MELVFTKFLILGDHRTSHKFCKLFLKIPWRKYFPVDESAPERIFLLYLSIYIFIASVCRTLCIIITVIPRVTKNPAYINFGLSKHRCSGGIYLQIKFVTRGIVLPVCMAQTGRTCALRMCVTYTGASAYERFDLQRVPADGSIT